MERFWTRLARGKLFMPLLSELICLASSVKFNYQPLAAGGGAPQSDRPEPLPLAGRTSLQALPKTAPIVRCELAATAPTPLDVQYRPAKIWVHWSSPTFSPCSSYRIDKFSPFRSEEHTSELQSLMRISYAVFC